MADFSSTRRSNRADYPFKQKPAKNATPAPTRLPPVQVGEHGRYQIKSGRLAGEYVARAFPKPPTNACGMIAEAKGDTEAAAIAALHHVIDAREVERTGQRRTDPTSGSAIPGTEEYVEAITQITLSRPQRLMLRELALADDAGLTEGRMARAAGYKSPASANRSFAAAGLLIAEYLSLDTPGDCEGTTWLGMRGEPRNEKDPGNWILHPELTAAVRSAL